MLTELLEEKKALMAALDAVNADLDRNESVYAVLAGPELAVRHQVGREAGNGLG